MTKLKPVISLKDNKYVTKDAKRAKKVLIALLSHTTSFVQTAKTS